MINSISIIPYLQLYGIANAIDVAIQPGCWRKIFAQELPVLNQSSVEECGNCSARGICVASPAGLLQRLLDFCVLVHCILAQTSSQLKNMSMCLHYVIFFIDALKN